jgi:hypothetical protein
VPYSDAQGKDWLQECIINNSPASILDIGVGAGTYSRLLRPKLRRAHFIGIEVFEPYVEMFDLHEHYDELIVADAREVEWPRVDVVIMGDVIEHMAYDDAVAMWDKARRTARKSVFVSLPIIFAPQGAEFGNEHERHMHHWTHEEVLKLPGIVKYWTGDVLGCYKVSPL